MAEDLPAHIRVLKNGSHYDTSIGRLVKGPDKPMITPENSGQMRELARRARERKARKAAVEAVEEFTGQSGLKPSDVVAEMSRQFTRSALENAPDKLRDAVFGAKFALQLQGLAPTEQQEQRQPAVSLSLSAEAVEYLGQLLQRAAPALGQIVDGEARDAG